MLWNAFKELRAQGIRFRRQDVIGNYIADFACPSAKLIIEIDGQDHADPDARRSNRQRDVWLRGQDYTVMRFGATDVLQNIEGVVEDIAAIAKAGRPSPF